MNSSSQWPPTDEPVYPTTVVARPDDMGWPAVDTVVVDHTDTHALIAYDDRRNVTQHVIVDMRGRGTPSPCTAPHMPRGGVRRGKAR